MSQIFLQNGLLSNIKFQFGWNLLSLTKHCPKHKNAVAKKQKIKGSFLLNLVERYVYNRRMAEIHIVIPR